MTIAHIRLTTACASQLRLAVGQIGGHILAAQSLNIKPRTARSMNHLGLQCSKAIVFAIAVVGLTTISAVDSAAQWNANSNWFDRWLNGDRGSSNGSYNSKKITLKEKRRQRVALDKYLRNENLLLSPETIQAVDIAIGRYRNIVASGGWPNIRKQKGAWLRLGARDKRVGLLRRRLAITRDHPPRSRGDAWTFDQEVELAVKRFQIRHGIRPTGVVGSRTLYALNVPADERLAQLQVNALRLRTFSEHMAKERRYVLVNVPSSELQAVRDNRLELYSKTIVGRPATQTPTIQAKIRGLNFFPFWRVPDSIAHRDLIPTLLKDPSYLAKERIRVLTKWGGEEVDPRAVDWYSPEAKNLKFRQDPGDRNALGLIRIDMPNEHIVYMHDTPLKKLFNSSSRTFSAGCVRVQQVTDLAAWLLSDEPEWNRARIDSVLISGIAEDVKLVEPVPVLFTYITAWGLGNGVAHFRPDVYGRDGTRAIVARYNDKPTVMQTLSP